MERPDLHGKNTYDQLRQAAEYVLKINDRTDDANAWGGQAVFEAVCHEFPKELGEANQNTFVQYLSNASRDPNSLINCRGRRRGYYISSVAGELVRSDVGNEDAESDDESVSLVGTPGGVVRREREAQLYPFLEAWLISQGYRAANVSSGRSNGRWGNPDVAGILALDAFEGTSLEIATIEAKASLDCWEKWIFEAVSHRRFANRSYFAFAHPEETIDKIPPEMRYYAELFGVGVLAISIENKAYKNLQHSTYLPDLDSDKVEVIEIYSAPFQFVQPRYQVQFCGSVGAGSRKELYQWGRGG